MVPGGKLVLGLTLQFLKVINSLDLVYFDMPICSDRKEVSLHLLSVWWVPWVGQNEDKMRTKKVIAHVFGKLHLKKWEDVLFSLHPPPLHFSTPSPHNPWNEDRNCSFMFNELFQGF